MTQDAHTVHTAAGAIRIEADALAGLVVMAVHGVAGARVRRPRRGLDIEIEDGSARVALEVAARYGSVLPELAGAVQRSVAEALGRAAGLTIAAVDVSIEELDE